MFGANPNIQSCYKPFDCAEEEMCHLLRIAVLKRNTEMTKLLLESGANVNHSQSALMLGAVAYHDLETLQVLVDAGVDINKRHPEPHRSAIVHILKQGSLKQFNIIKEAGADLHNVDPCASTALHYVVMRHSDTGHPVDWIKHVLLAGVDINAVDCRGRSSIFNAVCMPDIQVTQALVDHGANIHAVDYSGENVLHSIASNNGSLAAFELMVNMGVSMRATKSNRSILHRVAELNNHELLSYMLAAGLDPDATDDNSNTPLHLAVKHAQYSESIDPLIAANANPNAVNKDGNTPLHVAAGNLGATHVIIESLIKANADVRAVNNNGETPLDLAAKINSPFVQNLLASAQ